jgi:hypothetical protein
MRVFLFWVAKETYCGSPVHDRVFAHEPSLGIIKYDKLDWLVDPSVAETELKAFI